MKYIVKHGAPREYSDWRKSIIGEDNENFNGLLNPLKTDFHKALISEQGGLCAYTMKRIEHESSHFEHLKPETLCREDLRGSDLDYENLIACYPRKGMLKSCRYGAHAKGNWWENHGRQFVSPLHPRCESLIRFNKKGEILAVNDNPDAIITINVLKLDNETLTEERKRAISVYINGPKGDSPLPKKISETAISDIIKPNAKGEFVEYCIAIKHALVEHIAFLEKISLKKKYARNPKNRDLKR